MQVLYGIEIAVRLNARNVRTLRKRYPDSLLVFMADTFGSDSMDPLAMWSESGGDVVVKIPERAFPNTKVSASDIKNVIEEALRGGLADHLRTDLRESVCGFLQLTCGNYEDSYTRYCAFDVLPETVLEMLEGLCIGNMKVLTEDWRFRDFIEHFYGVDRHNRIMPVRLLPLKPRVIGLGLKALVAKAESIRGYAESQYVSRRLIGDVYLSVGEQREILNRILLAKIDHQLELMEYVPVRRLILAARSGVKQWR